MIDEFIVKYEGSQPEFIRYFRTNWCTEAKYNVWSRAYHPLEFSHLLTNNYIGSWHNQLKSVFLRRVRNKRLDRLIFILTDEVEYYYREEYDRVEVNHGPMTAAEREKRRVRLAAEAVPANRRAEMIVSPSGVTSFDDDEDEVMAEAGDWMVDSFVDEDNAYYVSVDEDNAVNACSCYYFGRNQRACKHMQLLCLHVSVFSLPSPTPMNIFPLSVQNAATASSSNTDESGEYAIPTAPPSLSSPSPSPSVPHYDQMWSSSPVV